jgi:hypothetical protein
VLLTADTPDDSVAIMLKKLVRTRWDAACCRGLEEAVIVLAGMTCVSVRFFDVEDKTDLLPVTTRAGKGNYVLSKSVTQAISSTGGLCCYLDVACRQDNFQLLKTDTSERLPLFYFMLLPPKEQDGQWR